MEPRRIPAAILDCQEYQSLTKTFCLPRLSRLVKGVSRSLDIPYFLLCLSFRKILIYVYTYKEIESVWGDSRRKKIELGDLLPSLSTTRNHLYETKRGKKFGKFVLENMMNNFSVWKNKK